MRSSKGFLFEAEDTPQPVLCRDVRGFPQALVAARQRSKPPGRLVIVVPDLAMDDWLTRWAEDESRARRNIAITRRVDGQRLRIVGTLLSYGYGVDTTIAIEAIEPASTRVESEPSSTESPPRSEVRAVATAKKPSKPAATRR